MSQRLSIFMAEDVPTDAELLCEALKECEVAFDLLLVEDWKSVASSVASFGTELPCPDVAVVDLYIPGADPEDILRLVRGNLACGDLPIIVVTASQLPEDLNLISLHKAKYVMKPRDWDQYLALAQQIAAVSEHPAS